MNKKIDLISPEILEQHRDLADELIKLNKSLGISSGWHYPMDWVWIISQLGDITGKTILDAGAGIGLLQWYLAQEGASVISVDRKKRTCIPLHLVNRFNVTGLSPDESPMSLKEILDIRNKKASLSDRLKILLKSLVGKLRAIAPTTISGSVKLYNQNLQALENIQTNSIDVIVSVSALEHNETISDVRKVYLELERILKPNGKMLITLPAAQEKDWFFTPAYSWCFTEKTLKFIFGIEESAKTNFNEYHFLFEKLKNSNDLRRNLSWRYYYSRNSGMPWGIWNPQYLPVGVIKEKTEDKTLFQRKAL